MLKLQQENLFCCFQPHVSSVFPYNKELILTMSAFDILIEFTYGLTGY